MALDRRAERGRATFRREVPRDHDARSLAREHETGTSGDDHRRLALELGRIHGRVEVDHPDEDGAGGTFEEKRTVPVPAIGGGLRAGARAPSFQRPDAQAELPGG